MKKIIATILIGGLLVPSFVHAEDAELKRLQAYVQILSEEVQKLVDQISGAQQKTYADPLTTDQMRQIITGGVMWFKNAQEENGHLKYEYVPYEDVYLNDDNIVRQAGGLYAMGEVARQDKENKYDLKSYMQTSIRYFDVLSNPGSANGKSFKCVSNSALNESCQLGTTALALIGLIDTVIAYPELKETYDGLIHDWGQYLVAMKKEGTGFRNKYTKGSALTESESSFYNGEALLALARYYKYSPDEEVKKVIDDSFDYFESDAVPFDFPLYLWAMAALKDMHELWPNERYVAYAKEYTNWRLGGFLHRKSSTHNMCAYVEGVASAYSVLEPTASDFEEKRIEREINFWHDRLKNLQIDENDQYRLVTDEEGNVSFGEITNMDLAFGGFLTGATKLTQRIDFTQHCINSYLQQLVDINGVTL